MERRRSAYNYMYNILQEQKSRLTLSPGRRGETAIVDDKVGVSYTGCRGQARCKYIVSGLYYLDIRS